MNYLLDFIFILIVAIFVFLSVKKGFVRSLIEVVGYVLAIVLAISISTPASNYIYDKAIEPGLITSIDNAIAEKSDEAIEVLPDYIKGILNDSDLFTNIENILSGDNDNSTAVAQQISDIVQPIAVGIIKTILSIVIFAILLIVVNILARIINSMFKGVVLGTANKVLGAALGGVKGLVFACIFSLAVYFITSVSTKDWLFFSSKAIDKSFICSRVIELILGKF